MHPLFAVLQWLLRSQGLALFELGALEERRGDAVDELALRVVESVDVPLEGLLDERLYRNAQYGRRGVQACMQVRGERSRQLGVFATTVSRSHDGGFAERKRLRLRISELNPSIRGRRDPGDSSPTPLIDCVHIDT